MKLEEMVREIPFEQLEGFRTGQAQNEAAGTGVTVILSEEGACGAVDISGGGPASRECALLDPLAANESVNAVVLSGGSAFGLQAAQGVMDALEARGIGFETGYAKVPIVVQSSLYDLGAGDSGVRPDAAMGREAAENAFTGGPLKHGCAGAGQGCTVGKILGAERAMKSGIGFYAVSFGAIFVGAAVAVNALGDIYDIKTGKKIAGLLAEGLEDFEDTDAALLKTMQQAGDLWSRGEGENTTIGCILTNADLSKAELKKVAQMGQNGYARAIRPVSTTADGDSLYVLSTRKVRSDVNAVGVLAGYVVQMVVRDAVLNSESLYGFKSAKDFAMINKE